MFYAIKDSNLYSSPCKRDALPIKLIAFTLRSKNNKKKYINTGEGT